LTSIIQPVSAGPVDTSIEVVARGIEEFMKKNTEDQLDNTFGVRYGNASEVEDLTPAQRLVYMVAAADHHPFELEWVRHQIASDTVHYYIAMFCLLVITFGLGMLHKVWPEFVDSITNVFNGHDDLYDYTVYMKTLLKLTVLPIAAFPIIEGLLEFEQGLSAGMLANALEFLNTSTVSGDVWFWEGWAYSFCGWFFAFRLQYMNLFIAHILKVILLFAFVWWNSHHIAEVLGEWFLSALAMRPIVLWYSCIAVQHIASVYENYGSFNANYGITPGMSPTEAYSQVWSTTMDSAGVVSLDMTLVVLASAATAAACLTWPIFKVVVKIVMGYFKNALFAVLSMYMRSKPRGTK
jgi:hypothetical protein